METSQEANGYFWNRDALMNRKMSYISKEIVEKRLRSQESKYDNRIAKLKIHYEERLKKLTENIRHWKKENKRLWRELIKERRKEARRQAKKRQNKQRNAQRLQGLENNREFLGD